MLAILAELIQQVEQAIRTVDGVFQTVDRVTTVATQGATMLKHLKDIDSLQDVLNALRFARSAIGTLQGIDRDIQHLGFQIDRIDQQRDALFPTQDSMKSIPSQDFPARAQRWNAALSESTMVAMRAQTSVESLQQRAETQQQILAASKGADGIVAQLQAVVAGLSLLHTDMAALETNLAAGMRVTATLARQAAAERDLKEEDHRRMMDKYDAEDAPGAVLTELP